jgi:hypothetical protein
VRIGEIVGRIAEKWCDRIGMFGRALGCVLGLVLTVVGLSISALDALLLIDRA